MTTASKYNIQVAWRTLAKDVFQLTRETVNAPATYRCTVKAVDTNNPGAGTKAIGYFMVDFWGVPYSIIGVSATTVDAQDDFRTGRCPTSGEMAIIYQSVFKGKALYLGQIDFQFLHLLAFSNYQKYSNALIWSNDPNTKKIPFASQASPGVSNYQNDQIDPEDATKIINYKEMYGDNPLVRLILTIDGTTKVHSMQNAIFTYDGLLLQSFMWDLGDPTSTGYILISKA